MKKTQIIKESKWKKELKHDYFLNDSDTLVIMLPGYGYQVTQPLFHYLTGMYFKLNYDILKINYGFQLAQVDIEFQTDIPIIVSEINQVLESIKSYQKVIIIGKSMGTLFIEELARKFEHVVKIYMTPTDNTLPTHIDLNALYIYGTADTLISESSMVRLLGAERLIIKHANHGLQTNDWETDLENMKLIVKTIENFS